MVYVGVDLVVGLWFGCGECGMYCGGDIGGFGCVVVCVVFVGLEEV